MKVSKAWLQELVNLKVSIDEVERLLPLRTIGLKEVTDDFIELDMKGYNRADLLSMRGVAREIAAITGSDVTFHDEPALKSNLPETKVSVEDTKLCPLYCVAKIEGLKVGASLEGWVKKLADSGVRSANNIADVTNLIMLEYGQPLHAFDAAQVKDETIIVRLASQGETLQTLDGKTRKLESSDLLITDPEKSLGLAGVMGGKNSEVSDSTTTILLEAAIFDGKNLRRTAQRLGLQSEASKRFQHGLTKKRLLQALNAASRMFEQMGGKLIALTISGDDAEISKKIPLTLEKVINLTGVDISSKEVEKYLTKLGFKLDLQLNPKSLIAWVVTPPYYRLDIEIEEDLIEEIARMYGYEKIPAKELKGEFPQKIDQSLFELIYNTKKGLADAGLTEVQTYSFYSTKVIENLKFKIENLVRVANPISSETEYMRGYIWPNLVEVVAKNMRQGYKDIAIFELGKIYQPVTGGAPKESYRLAIALVNGRDNPVEELLVILNSFQDLIDLQMEKGGMMEELEGLFHPKRYANIKSGNQVIGSLAEVHPRLLNNFGLDKRVAIVEIAIEL